MDGGLVVPDYEPSAPPPEVASDVPDANAGATALETKAAVLIAGKRVTLKTAVGLSIGLVVCLVVL
jgi:hypothetical protein